MTGSIESYSVELIMVSSEECPPHFFGLIH